ncbi:Tn7 transposase TnsA N-terminal domain-containing protein [Natronospira bacteriovora]|uniref:Tn7 transposase TnsA N-terminal domain-containing protein n=1 Tax=Natronospira bacteriovora TaxID=3069753 RepID=A0ABU0W741_9GAMM|nr:Tn7 transposase TnsA N-terminal domain-containing protein [Natronospira sp. AB-CW4]MDQ2069816.1 Tn7 transposase TnsA N-terminal domain-containing protein [Natronospira sp. AB-CW4]
MTKDRLAKQAVTRALWERVGSPVRSIGPSKVSVTGRVVTEKNDLPQPVESSLEQDFLTLLEANSDVVRYSVQPLTMRWTDRTGRRRAYTPDVLVEYCSRPPRLFEVKPRVVLRRDWDELRPRFRQAMAVARASGWYFKIVTDKEIRTPYLPNARFLLRFRRQRIDPDQTQGLRRQRLVRLGLAELGESTPRGVLETLSGDIQEQARLLPWLWNAVLEGFVEADLDRPLTMATRIRSLETEFTRRKLEVL